MMLLDFVGFGGSKEAADASGITKYSKSFRNTIGFASSISRPTHPRCAADFQGASAAAADYP